MSEVISRKEVQQDSFEPIIASNRMEVEEWGIIDNTSYLFQLCTVFIFNQERLESLASH
jgi:hypothetical protein